jgi:hypothetical protein
MGKLSKGILGGFSGTVGTVVGSTWRGIDYIRSVAKKSSRASSDLQKQQQEKFTLVNAFLQTMKPLILIGYKNQAKYMTELNSATGHIIKSAVTGAYPDYSIMYPEVEISRGSLPNGKNPMATAEVAGVINFNWTNNAGIGKAKPGDRAILVAYCEELQQTVFITDPLRSAAAGVLPVPEFSGMDVQTWISFLSEDKKDVSTSIFTGEVNVL